MMRLATSLLLLLFTVLTCACEDENSVNLVDVGRRQTIEVPLLLPNGDTGMMDDMSAIDMSTTDMSTTDMSASDMQTAECDENEQREAEECGWERCVAGVWQPEQIGEICNQRDDDCDGHIDEDPIANEQSNCCDEQLCYDRSVCEAGRCMALAQRSCLQSGDCEQYECVDNYCFYSFDFPAPETPASCASPIVLDSSSVVPNGQFADQLYTNTHCLPAHLIEDSARSYDMIYSIRLPIDMSVRFTGRVSVGQFDIPVSIIVLSTCPGESRQIDQEPLGCQFSVEGMATKDVQPSHQAVLDIQLSAGIRYYIILDPLASVMNSFMAMGQVDLSGVSYRLNATSN